MHHTEGSNLFDAIERGFAAGGHHAPARRPPLEYSGWPGYPRRRPLVLVSQDNTSDPQHWKPVKPPKPILRKCIQKFREIVGPVSFCRDGRWQPPISDYADSAIHCADSHGSRDGEYLLNLRFPGSESSCEEPLTAVRNASCAGLSYEACRDLIPWSTPIYLMVGNWLHVSRDGSVRHLGIGFTLVDAGDYDNDGRSEVVFWYSGYDRDGYVLYYNGFSDHADFTWNDH